MATLLALADLVLPNTGATAKRTLGNLFGGQGTVASFEDFGAVGDGTTDDTTAIQTAFNNTPDGGTILSYPGKSYSITSTINVIARTHVKQIGLLYGDCIVPGAISGQADAPRFIWNGAANGTMFYFRSCFNPTIKGFNFTSNATIDRYLKFDDNNVVNVAPNGPAPTGQQTTGSAGVVENCNFLNPNNNINFKAIAISETSTNNHENYTIRRCNIQGVSAGAIFSGKDIVGNGTKTITSASNPWGAATPGQRIRLSWQVQGQGGSFATAGSIDDTIATVNNAGSIVLTTNNAPTLTGITAHVTQGWGIGIYIGDNQNAKHMKIEEITTLVLQYSFVQLGGSFSIRHLLGENDDFNVCYGYNLGNPNNMPSTSTAHMTEPCEIAFLESEGPIIAVYGAGGPMTISSARLDNTRQSGLGFFQLTDATLLSTGLITSTPGPNQVLVGRIGGFGAGGQIVSRGNIWGMVPAQVGITTWNGYQFAKSQWNAADQFADNCLCPIIGAALRQSNLPTVPVPGMMQIIADSNKFTPGDVINGTGSFVVLAMYNFGNGTPGWVVVANIT